MLLLFPPTVLALISNNAVPGDSTYPIKRKLEDGVLIGASLTPGTKAMFATNRSNRRFDETKILIAKGNQDANESLDELVSQTAIAAAQIEEVKDPVQKEELKQQLTELIQKYNQSLNQIQEQVEKQSPVSVVVTSTITSTPLLSVTQTPVPVLSPTLTSAPKPVFVTQTPTPTVSPTAVLTQTLSPSPTPTPTVNPAPVSGDNPPVSVDKLDDAQKKLKKIQDELQKDKSSQDSDNNQRDNNKNKNNKNKDR